jgi:hypothetical protein
MFYYQKYIFETKIESNKDFSLKSSTISYILQYILYFALLKKTERDAGPKHKGDGKSHHPRRTIGKYRQHERLGLSIYMGDGIFRHPYVAVLSHAWLF